MSGCQLSTGCDGVSTARVAVARRSTGAVAYLTVVPAAYGQGGVPACADCVHGAVDTMLLASLGPVRQPDRERLDDPPAGTR